MLFIRLLGLCDTRSGVEYVVLLVLLTLFCASYKSCMLSPELLDITLRQACLRGSLYFTFLLPSVAPRYLSTSLHLFSFPFCFSSHFLSSFGGL